MGNLGAMAFNPGVLLRMSHTIQRANY